MLEHRILFIRLALLSLAITSCGLLQEPEEASGPIAAVPLEEPTETVEVIETEASPTENASERPTVEAQPDDLILAQISQDESQVRFELDEDLRGQRNTVVGITNQVSGEIAINPTNIAESRVGVILINARTLQTDNSFRNRAIQNSILNTGPYEFITFFPVEIRDLPFSANIGDEIHFSIIGDLTIRDITQSVTFDVRVTVVSESEMVGSASGVINRSDYRLTIPSVPNVANVEEEVELYIDFVAKRS